jgi:hypothetical protein
MEEALAAAGTSGIVGIAYSPSQSIVNSVVKKAIMNVLNALQDCSLASTHSTWR